MHGDSEDLEYSMMQLEFHSRLEDVMVQLATRGVRNKTQKLVRYPLDIRGKRLRPQVAFWSSRVCGGTGKDVLYPAAALEILHNYTLIIDDIIDGSEERRGSATLWKKFGKSIAECVSIDYGAMLLQAAARSLDPVGTAEVLALALKKVVDGEILDILFEQGGRGEESYVQKHRVRGVTLDAYLEMIGKKTAVLFEVACELGCRAAAASQQKTRALTGFGRNFGFAYQIADDILDFYGNRRHGGRPGQDIRERKLGNVAIIFVLKEASLREQAQITRVLQAETSSDEDVRRVLRIAQTTNARESSYKLVETYVGKARRHLDCIPNSIARNELAGLLEGLLKMVA